MKIGILFSDNDFYLTLEAFMRQLLYTEQLFKEPFVKRLTKPRLVMLFNSTATGLYWLYQNRFEYSLDWEAGKYLQIEEKHVYLGDEVDAFLKDRQQWANGEFQWVDLGVSSTVHCV